MSILVPSGVRPYVFLGFNRSSGVGSEQTVLPSPGPSLAATLAGVAVAAGLSVWPWRWRSWACCSRFASGAELMVGRRGLQESGEIYSIQRLEMDETMEGGEEDLKKKRKGRGGAEMRRAKKKKHKNTKTQKTASNEKIRRAGRNWVSTAFSSENRKASS